MRKLKLIEHISLDGVIEISSAPAEESGFPYGDWSAPYRTPEGLARLLAIYGERFDLLLGRKTYDQWSRYWPTAPASHPMTERLNAATKHVVTHRPESLRWGPVQNLGPDAIADVRALKAADGPDLILSGSSTLTSTLIEHGLADEVVLLVNPVLLGKGRRLFAEGAPPRALALVSAQALPSGIVINQFAFEGPLRNLK